MKFTALALPLALAGCSLDGADRFDGPSLADQMSPGADAPDLDAVPWLRVSKSPLTGAYDMVLAVGDAVLVADDASRAPETRAVEFLSRYGSIVGLGEGDRRAVPASPRDTRGDALGRTHVRLSQTHRGLPVIGAELIVHMDHRGVTGVNGNWIPEIGIDATPRIDAATAKANALRFAGATETRATELAVYSPGLLRGTDAEPALAYGVDVAGPEGRHRVWVDARHGKVIDKYALDHETLHRVVYTPSYDPDNPDQFVAREEGDPPSLIQSVNDLYDFSGDTYNLFAEAFDRDSFDGAGAIMRTVYLVNGNCPNAYWDGSTTNYCPGFELDDVVAHEWGHAYTQHTHGLIYSYQSGALNESYSDIWGEVVDMHNNADGLAGGNNDAPAPAGNRWQVGEDFGTGSGEYELLLRDMWDPERLGYPGHVTSDSYRCSSGDQGGVHSNSGVPNHAFAMLVDGKTYNGVTVTGIGFTKAIHIYYRAMVVYQTPSSNFQAHADALEASCADLVGAPLPTWSNLEPASGPITADDCAQVANAMLATEMRTPPTQCNFQPQLDPRPAPTCSAGAAVFSEDWSGGLGDWTRTSNGVNPEWPGYQWELVTTKPDGEPGNAAFAPNKSLDEEPSATCAPGGDHSGTYTLDSPVLSHPGGTDGLELVFDHYVETEANYDGGNITISVNGGPFELVPFAAYRYNAPQGNLAAAPPLGQNTNPKAGERAWHGANQGSTVGSWGTTIIDLSQLVGPGDSFQFRFDFGIDGCNGVTGWYVGDVRVSSCPSGPTLAAAAGSPDSDGTFGLSWDRATGATGPDEVEQSAGSCGPALSDDAESGLANWETELTLSPTPWDTGDVKPLHASAVFYTEGVEHSGGDTSLTTAAAIDVPAGGTASLEWLEWYVNEPDDLGLVEVSADGGTTWSQVYSVDRSMIAAEADAAFATEEMERRSVDLSAFAGQSILIRFRYLLGPSNYFFYKPNGWYLDDIVVKSSAWTSLGTVDGTATTVSGRADGTYCYRVRSYYGEELGPYSNEVEVTVLRDDGAADSDGDTVADPDDNCPADANTDQADADGDGEGDVCDTSPPDGDGDGVADFEDNCPETANGDQADTDGDGTGDACDPTPNGEDSDGDGIPDHEDNCWFKKNKNQKDRDGDGIGDKCDDWPRGGDDDD